MSLNDGVSALISLLSVTPDGLHRRVILRKLSIGSDASFYRMLAAARDLFDAEIECQNHKYVLVNHCGNVPDRPQSPTDQELIAFASLRHILDNMACNTLSELFEPLHRRFSGYMDAFVKDHPHRNERIKILDSHYRQIPEGIFSALLVAAEKKHVVQFTYTDAHGASGNRVVSPLHLVRYKDNWYLDAWCHKNSELRIFSLDSVTRLRNANTKFIAPSPEHIQEIYATAYGIFSGIPDNVAVIKFTGLAARYVLRESWHPRQKLLTNSDGSVLLEIPYHKPQELLRSILSWGPEAEVLAPENLRKEIARILTATTRLYG